MKQLRAGGASVRKLAKDFSTSQWMVSRLTSPAGTEAPNL